MSVLLVGCGRMGGALAKGWAGREEVAVFDPAAAPLDGTTRLETLEDALQLPRPLVVVVAVKPQILKEVLSSLRPLADSGALFISVVAGATIAGFRESLGDTVLVARAMPNTPAAIGQGITAVAAGPGLEAEHCARAAELLGAVGEVVWVEKERDMDAVTAVSGSGPAYFFRFAEALAQAGADLGLPPEIAMRLARQTFVGAAALAVSREEPLEALRQEVTSPGGTTAAALAAFDQDQVLDRAVGGAVKAAARRSEELAS
jgi:pyrroline-5-carboxylate reductase